MKPISIDSIPTKPKVTDSKDPLIPYYSMKRSAQFIIFQGVTTFVINYYQIEHKDKNFDKNNQGNPTITFSQ